MPSSSPLNDYQDQAARPSSGPQPISARLWKPSLRGVSTWNERNRRREGSPLAQIEPFLSDSRATVERTNHRAPPARPGSAIRKPDRASRSSKDGTPLAQFRTATQSRIAAAARPSRCCLFGTRHCFDANECDP